MWGIIPAAGLGSRIQPLAFSKELLPVGSRRDGDTERPRAVSEHLVDRMIEGGARRLCFVISPGKSDIVGYFGGGYGGADMCYVVQPSPLGLCDAVFRALPFVRDDEEVLLGLPDTVWFPTQGFRLLGEGGLWMLLFPVRRPELFDAVVTDEEGRVREVQVKAPAPATRWVWGAMKTGGRVLRELYDLWGERDCRDVYLGTLINGWLARGGHAVGVKGGEAYVDVGTLNGYREAAALLEGRAPTPAASAPRPAPPSASVLATWPPAADAAARATNDDDELGLATGTGEAPI